MLAAAGFAFVLDVVWKRLPRRSPGAELLAMALFWGAPLLYGTGDALRWYPLFTFLIAWNSYLWALVLTTDSSMYVLSVGIANMVGEYRVQWNELMAAAVIAAPPVRALYTQVGRRRGN